MSDWSPTLRGILTIFDFLQNGLDIGRFESLLLAQHIVHHRSETPHVALFIVRKLIFSNLWGDVVGGTEHTFGAIFFDQS